MRPGDRGGRGRGKKRDGTGDQSEEASGRSRGGFGTEIHAVVRPLGHPVVIAVTGSQASDGPPLPGRIAGLETDAVVADKGYDSAANRVAVVAYDRHLYQERNVAERYFARIKPYRRVATRYDKKAANFLRFVWVASIAIVLA